MTAYDRLRNCESDKGLSRTAVSMRSFFGNNTSTPRSKYAMSHVSCDIWHMRSRDGRIYGHQQSPPSRILLGGLCGPVTGHNRRGAGQSIRRAKPIGSHGAFNLESIPASEADARKVE